MFGLLQRDMDYIKECILEFPEIEAVIIFGSRAIGNYKKGSDVDLAIIGKEASRDTIIKLSDGLNERYPLPYFFDVLDYKEIDNDKLKEHIDSEGKMLFKK